jgi:hypothetical protein
MTDAKMFAGAILFIAGLMCFGTAILKPGTIYPAENYATPFSLGYIVDNVTGSVVMVFEQISSSPTYSLYYWQTSKENIYVNGERFEMWYPDQYVVTFDSLPNPTTVTIRGENFTFPIFEGASIMITVAYDENVSLPMSVVASYNEASKALLAHLTMPALWTVENEHFVPVENESPPDLEVLVTTRQLYAQFSGYSIQENNIMGITNIYHNHKIGFWTNITGVQSTFNVLAETDNYVRVENWTNGILYNFDEARFEARVGMENFVSNHRYDYLGMALDTTGQGYAVVSPSFISAKISPAILISGFILALLGAGLMFTSVRTIAE